ncbi:MAG: ASPIC/UnbV domain-containing protein [Planctomycetaceae bacterium]
MLPACYQNRGDSGFDELTGASAGNFFSEPALGRAVSRLDWNRDGLPDLAVTSVGTSAALLTNITPDAGNFVKFQLVGTSSERCAFGARVQLDSGDRTWTRQLVAGDGFSAANQRCLIFGIDDRSKLDRVIVTWPSGRIQTYKNPEPNSHYTIVEDSNKVWKKP